MKVTLIVGAVTIAALGMLYIVAQPENEPSPNLSSSHTAMHVVHHS